MNGRRKLVLANRRNSVRVNCVAQFRRMSRTMSPCRRSYTNVLYHWQLKLADRKNVTVDTRKLLSLFLAGGGESDSTM